MQLLPVLPEETIAATWVSARRAREYAAEADHERSRTWDADLRRIEEEWQGAGSESLGGTWCAANELTREYAQRHAHNIFYHHFVAACVAKHLRASFRRYHRLKYQRYLQHPLSNAEFVHPDFPENPGALLWRAALPLQAWSSPPVGHQTREWGTGPAVEWGTEQPWGAWDLWGRPPKASFFTESDDEISPVFRSVPLPE
ncbi:hypothetical protein B0H14DRAFT_3426213 [Mycena olivaceomarginata]|nr:hypothetical protein B0H14DRAFT_3426213 [Mycena olivaceomarginata]